MLTLIILLFLIIGFYTGTRRGLLLQLLYTFGYSITYLVAQANYKDLASKLTLFIPYPSPTEETKLVFFDQNLTLELDQAFYGAVAFILILVIGWLIIRFLAIFAHGLKFVPFLKQTNGLAGGALNFIITYVGIFLILMAFSMIPLDSVQNQFENSGLAQFIVKDTPIFSNQIYKLWVDNMIQ